MAKLVVFYINDKEGDFNRGFPVSLRIRQDGHLIGQKVDAFLPPSPDLLEHYRVWQSGYVNLVASLQSSRQVKARKATNVSIPKIIAAGEQLKNSVNDWLNSEELMPIIHKLDEKLSKTDDILFVVNTKSANLQRLPWYFWDFFDSYGKAEVALSFPVTQRKLLTIKDKVKILAVFGDNQTSGDKTVIDIDKDWELLQEHLINAEFCTLKEPTLERLHERLWEKTPDIFYYGGHSSIEADGTTTTINIKKDEKIQINDLIKALKKAGERGLQLAIFNSCEGLGIARQLANSSIPQVIVMREAVPDEVARRFLEYFLKEFANGKPLYLAVREARERMGYLENKYPGATWLPMIFQNPAELPYTWKQIQGISSPDTSNHTQVNETNEMGNSGENKQSKNVNAPLRIFCSDCGVANLMSSIFCSQCGFNLHQTQYQPTGAEIFNNTLEVSPQPTLSFPPTKPNTSSKDTGSFILKTRENTNLYLNSGYLLNNRYRVLRTLAAGGFGTTFLAQDTHLPSKRECVIKQLKTVEHFTSELHRKVQELFAREAAILEDLGNGCRQIPSLYAYFDEDNQFYLVQEYIEGTALDQLLHQGLLSESAVKEILINILPVLDYIHDKGIIHRDIKPQNILIRESDKKPVLIDFGAVKEVVSVTDFEDSVSTAIGTPGFMPVEQATGRPAFASDLYALGITAIFLLTGKYPSVFEEEQTSKIIWQNFASHVSPAFVQVLDKSTQPIASERYASAKEMLDAIQKSCVKGRSVKRNNWLSRFFTSVWYSK